MALKAYLFSNGFGNLGGGLSEYYLASAFDEIILQPNTDVGITGISIEMPFVRNLLDKIGIVPEFYSRYEYKNALVSFTDNKMSDTVREELSKLGDNLLNQIIDGIAISRKIMPEMLKKLVDKAPFTDQEAVEFKLVDRLLYQENLMDELEQKYSAKRADWKDYFAVLYQPDNNYPVIGTLILSGEIVEGESVLDPMNGEMAVGADTVVEQLNELAEIKNLRALIIRIDSPGGSYVASDIIRQAIADFKNDKKIPVIVSMSSSAASGGYFAALSADKIIADAATLTGSIGVLGGKPVFAKLWQKLGVEWDRVNFGKNSGILSFNTSFSDTEKKIFNRALDRIYEDFTNKVSDARGISKNELDKLARGRVWTGDQAVKMRLIDIVGGYNEAFAVAKEMAEMESNGAFKSVVYPRAKTIQEKIAELMSVSPFALMNKLKMQIGLDNTSVNMLNRLKYDAVMPPVVVKY